MYIYATFYYEYPKIICGRFILKLLKYSFILLNLQILRYTIFLSTLNILYNFKLPLIKTYLKQTLYLQNARKVIKISILKRFLSVLISGILSAAAITFLITLPVTAAPITQSKVINWYTTRSESSQPPQLDSNLRVIEKYNAYYLNKSASDQNKVIYLTFDAGYENGNIAKILDILHEHNATSAFFVLSHVITADTDLVIRMVDEGHLVCNHTVKHRDMSLLTEKTEFAEELAKLEDLYRQYTGHKMAKIYRPPEGRFSELNLRHATELGYVTVFWSFAYADWDNNNQPHPDTAREKILANTHNGAIILMHPNSETNTVILDSLLDEWELRGYRFGSLEEFIEKSGDETNGTQQN